MIHGRLNITGEYKHPTPYFPRLWVPQFYILSI